MFKRTFCSQYQSFDRLIKRIKNDYSLAVKGLKARKLSHERFVIDLEISALIYWSFFVVMLLFISHQLVIIFFLNFPSWLGKIRKMAISSL